MVNEINKKLKNIQDFQKLIPQFDDFEEKIKHLSVFASELANLMLPQKLSATYFGN